MDCLACENRKKVYDARAINNNNRRQFGIRVYYSYNESNTRADTMLRVNLCTRSLSPENIAGNNANFERCSRDPRSWRKKIEPKVPTDCFTADNAFSSPHCRSVAESCFVDFRSEKWIRYEKTIPAFRSEFQTQFSSFLSERSVHTQEAVRLGIDELIR